VELRDADNYKIQPFLGVFDILNSKS